MALVTIQRSPSPSTDPDLDVVDSSEDVSEGRSQLRKRSKTSKEKLRKIFSTVRFLSKLRPCLSESYFTVKGAALILPHTECSKKNSKKTHGGEIQSHLQAMLHLLRTEDTIKIAVRLEDAYLQHNRYMALVSTRGRQDTEEAVILGIDCIETHASIGLVLPVWMGLKIKLGGDGGFSLCTDEQAYLFKPVSVQAMWSAIQSLVKAQHVAEEMKYIHDGLTHTWVGYYRSQMDHGNTTRMYQWTVEGVEVFAPSSLSIKLDGENEKIKLVISQKLKEVMMTVDLDEATSVMLRKAVEEKMRMSLAEFKSYFDEEVMRILGQMDEPSQILEFLYLGSEWNASNLEELKEKGIGYILNVTKEIDNFFVGMFQYYNVRVYDVEEADLLKHWDKTYKFIDKARNHTSKVLVHCKMGVSRSASTVMAFLMKDRRWSVEKAYDFVKERRNCVHPNSGFMEQLNMYQAILTASNKRDIFRCKSDQNLLDEGPKDELELSQGSFLGDSLFHVMSHSDWPAASESVAHEEELSQSLHQVADMLHIDTDLETAESRSADSMEESFPDLQSPLPADIIMTVAVSLPGHSTASSSSVAPCAVEGVLESGTDSNSQSGWCSSEGSERTSTSFMTASLSGQASRIKPDNSWISMPVSLDSCTEHLPFIETLPLDAVASTTPSFSFSTSTGATASSSFVSLGESAYVNTLTPVPTSVPDCSSQCNLDKHTAAGEDQNSQQSEVALIILSSDTGTVVMTGQSLDPVLADQSSESDPGNQPLGTTVASPKAAGPTGQTEESQAADTLERGDSALSTSPHSKIELGVRQYFFREKIPWKPGKVKKIQADINKTGHMCQDFVVEEEDTARRPRETVLRERTSESDLPDERVLIGLLGNASMAQSHSCVELCTPEVDATPRSLYEREEIPMEPGTVLRTRLEIEERQRLFCGEGDQEILGSSRPVVRTSSLKEERDVQTKCTDKSKPVMSPVPGNSWDALPSMDVSHLGSIPNPQSLSKDWSLRETVSLGQAQMSQHHKQIDRKSDGDDDSKDPSQISFYSYRQSRARSNLNPEMLAMIREIGSAMLMNSQTQENDKPCTNMVKYFVRQIEKQTQTCKPTHNIILIDNASQDFLVSDATSTFQSQGSDSTDAGNKAVRPKLSLDNELLLVALPEAADSQSSQAACGSESPDASVVRQLVDRFEIHSPETERATSEFVPHHSYRWDTSSSGGHKILQKETVDSVTLSDSLPATASQVNSSISGTCISPAASGSKKSLLTSFEFDASPNTVCSSSRKDELFSSGARKKTGPTETSVEGECWRPVRPKSTEYPDRSASSSDARETKALQYASSRPARDKLHNSTCDDSTSLRQVSDEGRKIRRLHGISHPLTKLEHRKGPFYSSM